MSKDNNRNEQLTTTIDLFLKNEKVNITLIRNCIQMADDCPEQLQNVLIRFFETEQQKSALQAVDQAILKQNNIDQNDDSKKDDIKSRAELKQQYENNELDFGQYCFEILLTLDDSISNELQQNLKSPNIHIADIKKIPAVELSEIFLDCLFDNCNKLSQLSDEEKKEISDRIIQRGLAIEYPSIINERERKNGELAKISDTLNLNNKNLQKSYKIREDQLTLKSRMENRLEQLEEVKARWEKRTENAFYSRQNQAGILSRALTALKYLIYPVIYIIGKIADHKLRSARQEKGELAPGISKTNVNLAVRQDKITELENKIDALETKISDINTEISNLNQKARKVKGHIDHYKLVTSPSSEATSSRISSQEGRSFYGMFAGERNVAPQAGNSSSFTSSQTL